MDKQKQIEEMAKVLEFCCNGENIENCNSDRSCDSCRAKYLYNAGYRKGETISFQAMVNAQNTNRWEQGYCQGVKDILKWLKRHGFNTEVKYLAEVYEVEVE